MQPTHVHYISGSRERGGGTEREREISEFFPGNIITSSGFKEGAGREKERGGGKEW